MGALDQYFLSLEKSTPTEAGVEGAVNGVEREENLDFIDLEDDVEE